MAQQLSAKMTAFLSARLEYFNSLKSHNESQTILINLGKIYLNGSELSPTDFRVLKTLLSAEQANEKAAAATRAARKIISKENEKNHKQRTHNMINAAGLLGLAGLLDKTTGKPTMSHERLLGALVTLANQNPTEQEKHHWDEIGRKTLETARAKKQTN